MSAALSGPICACGNCSLLRSPRPRKPFAYNLISTGIDGSVLVWDQRDGSLVYNLTNSKYVFGALDFNITNKKYIGDAPDYTLISNSNLPIFYIAHRLGIAAVKFDPTSSTTPVYVSPLIDCPFASYMLFLSDGNIVTVCKSTLICIFNVTTFTLVSSIETNYKHLITDLKLLSGNFLASSSWSQRIEFWDLTGFRFRLSHRSSIAVDSLILQLINNDLIASGNWDYTVHIFSIKNGSLINILIVRAFFFKLITDKLG